MAYLTKKKIRDILQNSPKGTTQAGIISGLREQGHILEGHPMEEADRTNAARSRGLFDAVPLDEQSGIGEGTLSFGKNVLKSGSRFVGETVKGLAQLVGGTLVNTAETVATPFLGSERAENLINAPEMEAVPTGLLKAAGGGVINTIETSLAPVAGAINFVAGTELDSENLINAPEMEGIASAIGHHFADRTGVVDMAKAIAKAPLNPQESIALFKEGAGKLGKTAFEDPVGLLSDVALIATGVGGALRAGGKGAQLTGKLAKTSTFLDDAGKFVAKTGQKVEPISLGAKATSKVANAAAAPIKSQLDDLAIRMYQSTLKPSKGVLDKFPEVVRTGLDEGIILSRGSIDDVRGIMDEIDDAIDVAIETAGKGGKIILSDDVITRLDDTVEFFKNAIGGDEAIAELDDLAKGFRKQFGDEITVAQAQKIKKTTQAVLRKQYGELKNASMEGRKALTRGLRETIEEQVSEIGGLNARQKQLIGLEKALDRFIGRTGNHAILGLSGEVGAATGAATRGVKGAVKGAIIARALKGIIENPVLKSRMALMFYQLSKQQGLTQESVNALRRFAIELESLTLPERADALPDSSQESLPPSL